MRASVRHSSAGFTLIELILVVLIIGTLAVVVTANLGAGIQTDRLVVETRDFAATLRLAADRAALTGRRHRVVIGLEAGTLTVEEEADPLDAPGTWSPIALHWAKQRQFRSPVAWGLVLIEPDDENLRQDLSAEEVAVVRIAVEPDGLHLLEMDEAVLEYEPEEGQLLQIQITGGEEDTPLYVRLEPTGRVRVFNEEELKEEQERIEELAR